ncbi:hypothetical protein FRC14_003331 [Serendipita sp. 396]|nr:hypothetical protein FRC14_003331 [Serendipita sp. 396]KAG8776803.1 hypothetical protein FRC15_011745 [Serendipita sp. 397]KAG8799451.1 hypothetical protein FRC16_005076 [Serendipita sp. 398]
MSAATRLGPLSAILTTANDLFLTLNFFRDKNVPDPIDFSSLERDLTPLPLTLATPPDLALSLRSLGISKSTTSRICQVYNDRIGSLRETTITQYRSAEMTLSSYSTQIKLAEAVIGAFGQSVRDLHDQAVDAALDTLAITSEQPFSVISPSAATSRVRKTTSRSNKGPSRGHPSGPLPSQSSNSSDTSQHVNLSNSSRSTPSSSRSSGASSPLSRSSCDGSESGPANTEVATGVNVFDKSVVLLLEYIFTNQGRKYPTVEEKKQLQAQTGLTYRQIAVWFQNRRARQKKRGEKGLELPAIDIESAVAQIERQQIVQTAALIPKERQRIHLIQVVARRETRLIHELPEDLGPNQRDIQEADIRRQMDKRELPSIDNWTPSPNGFPKPFEMPDYEMPTFDTVEYPRQLSKTSPSSHTVTTPVSSDDFDQLSELFDRLTVQHSKIVTFKRRHHIVMTLPEDQNLASRIRQKVQSLATQQESEGGIEVWLANRVVYDLRELEDSLQLQAQIISPNAAQDHVEQDIFLQEAQVSHQVSRNATTDQSTQPQPNQAIPAVSSSTADVSTESAAPPARFTRRRTRSRRQVDPAPDTVQQEATISPVSTVPPVSSVPFSNGAASSSVESLQTVGSSIGLNTPQFSSPELPPEIPDIEILDYASVFGDKQEVLSLPLEFDVLEGVPMTNEKLDEALKMTLTELGCPEQYVEKSFVRIHQAQIQEVPYIDIWANMYEGSAANPGFPSPMDPELATDPAYTQGPDPYGSLTTTKTSPSSWDRDASIAWAQANYPNVSVDTYLGPTLRQYDPQGPSLPFALSDLNDKPEHFDHPMPTALYTWEPTIPTTLFTFEGKPIPEHDPNLKWETIIDYFEGHIQKAERREARWAKRQNWPLSSTDPRSMLQYLNL